MRRSLAILCIAMFTFNVFARNPGVIRGSISVSFLWDNSAAVTSSNEKLESFNKINGSEDYSYYSHSAPEEKLFQTVERTIGNEKVITFIEL